VTPRPLRAPDLRRLVPDAHELAKGTRLFDDGRLTALVRHRERLHAAAEGSGTVSWQVSLVLGEAPLTVSARCTCPAAMRGLCKHAVALLVAWARTPGAFAVSGTSPEKRSRKRAVLRGPGAPDVRMKQGVTRVAALVRDLAVTGAVAITHERASSVRDLGHDLRDLGLRRLAARTLDLADMLDGAAARRGSLDAMAYADASVDLVLTARRIDRHLATGAPLDERHVEELIGRTWQKADRHPVGPFDLVEYAYLVRTTSDAFVVRESRLVDLRSGAHFSERQVVPLDLVPRTDPKPSRAGAVRVSAAGSAYPGYPPARLDLGELGAAAPLDHAAIERLVAVALPDVEAALLALREHQRDLVAPDVLPVSLRVPLLVSQRGRLRAVDAAGRAVQLPADPGVDAWLVDALAGGRLVALLGDLGVDAALPTLWPLAAVVERAGTFTIVSAIDDDGPSARTLSSGPRARSRTSLHDARAAGASPGAIALAELRIELAEALVAGLGALDRRAAEPIAARLADLGLDPEADALRAIAARSASEGPAEGLEGFVKLFHVLGVALRGLASAAVVDRAALVPVPDQASVFVARPDRWLQSAEVARRRAAGSLDRHEAALHLAHHVSGLPLPELVASVDALWADGSASIHVARAFAGRREEALVAAQRVLDGHGYRVSRMTAVRVLATAGGIEAEARLHATATRGQDPGLRALATELLPGRNARRDPARRARVDDASATLRSARTRDLRGAAARALVDLGDRAAIPALRRAWAADASQEVRAGAALALAELGDTDAVPALVGALGRRALHEASARTATLALGAMGDVRGVAPLLEALAEGWNPSVVVEALRVLGAVGPLLDRIEASGGLVRDRATRAALAPLAEPLARLMIARLRERAGTPGASACAGVYIDVASLHPTSRRDVGAAIVAALPPSADPAVVEAARRAAR
jgi:HEAT repeat protein